jgi:CsoR family transcriptional regulator, copper-sensing transcriptional repressor
LTTKVQAADETKAELQRRLRRIEGQVRGVQKMLDEDRQCHEILQQLTAIRSAVQGASLMFVQQYASDCLLGADSDSKAVRKVLLDDLVGLLGKVQ